MIAHVQHPIAKLRTARNGPHTVRYALTVMYIPQTVSTQKFTV
jgi:hypothetical protein